MGCFLACFTSSNKLSKRHKSVAAVTPSSTQHQILEATEEAVQFRPDELTELEDNVKALIPIKESKDETKELSKKSTEKKVTFDLVESNIDDEKEEAPEEIEDFSDCIKSSVALVVLSHPVNHRYENCANIEDEYVEGVIDLEGSEQESSESLFSLSKIWKDECDEGNVDDDVEIKKQNLIQEQESSESLFSISIDSRKQVTDAEVDEKEVNSPMPEPIGSDQSGRDDNNTRSQQHCDSVLNPIENLTHCKKEVKERATPAGSKHQDKENINVEQDFCVLFSPEPTLKLPKQFSRRTRKTNDEIELDTSLSSWLVASETSPKSNASNNSVGNLMCEKVSSSRSHEDRSILGAWTSEELNKLSASSTPNQSQSQTPDEIPIIGTVGSYWSRTGQAMDSDSNSSCLGMEKTARRSNKEDEKVKSKTNTFNAKLERVLDLGVL